MKALRMSLVVALVATAAVAQLHESITVEVVDVPVYVYNATTPLRNLTKDDFELYVNGRRQPIDYFDRLEFSSAPSAAQPAEAEPAPMTASAPADPRDRRMFMLVFDLAMSRAAALARARDAAMSMVDNAGPADYFAVVTWDMRRGAQYVVPFMKDHEAIRTAVQHLAPRRDPLALATTSIAPEAARLAASGHFTETMMSLSEMPEKRMIDDQLNDFASIADRLAVLEGYKHVVLFSEGVNPRMIFSARVDPHMIDSFSGMLEAFRAAGAFIDAIDLSSPLRPSADSDALRAMAHGTGGQFIHWENNLKTAVASLARTTSTVYRLGFKPVKAHSGQNSVQVKVRNVPHGTMVSFRPGFSTDKDYAIDAGYEMLRLADIVLNDIPQSGITASTAIENRELVVTLPTKTLLAAQDGLGVTADLLVYVFDKKGTAVDFVQKQAVITNEDQNDVVIRQPLRITAGDYVVKTLLRARKSIGFTRQVVTIR
jgi:VWFA-related protein